MKIITKSYRIMPPLIIPRTGSCQVLYRSCISSCLWAWAQTSPAYLVTSGQSWEATTYGWNMKYLHQSVQYPEKRYTTKKKKPIWESKNMYSCYRGARVFSVLRMGHICSKYYGRYVTNQWNSTTYSIQKYGISATHLLRKMATEVRKEFNH